MKRIIIISILLMPWLTDFAQKPDWNQYIVEVSVEDYPFMEKIVDYINSTDITITTPKGEKTNAYSKKIFQLEIFDLSAKCKPTSFTRQGWYFIEIQPCIAYAKMNYKFNIKDFTFVTYQDLHPYITSCSVKREIAPESMDDVAFDGNCTWWNFEIKDSKIVNAFFKCEDGPVTHEEDLPVYNLIDKQLMTKNDYLGKYPHLYYSFYQAIYGAAD